MNQLLSADRDGKRSNQLLAAGAAGGERSEVSGEQNRDVDSRHGHADNYTTERRGEAPGRA